jgi:hypothetical protein
MDKIRLQLLLWRVFSFLTNSSRSNCKRRKDKSPLSLSPPRSIHVCMCVGGGLFLYLLSLCSFCMCEKLERVAAIVWSVVSVCAVRLRIKSRSFQCLWLWKLCAHVASSFLFNLFFSSSSERPFLTLLHPYMICWWKKKNSFAKTKPFECAQKTATFYYYYIFTWAVVPP